MGYTVLLFSPAMDMVNHANPFGGNLIQLNHCKIEWTPTGCRTSFSDGSSIASFPHEIPHYYIIAHRCGYGDDLLAYCREHDFFHGYCEEYFNNRASPILWSLAHGDEIVDSVYEELVVQTCQRWVRCNERPIIGGVDWDNFKQKALNFLEQ